MSEEEILRQLRFYIKQWKKGGYITGALKSKLDTLLFYKDWVISGHASKETRHRLWLIKTQGGKCANPNCGTTLDLTQDHVFPRSKGGSNSLKNKQLLCGRCNKRKGAKVPTLFHG